MNEESKNLSVPTPLYAFSISYFITGIMLLVGMTQSRYVPIHLGIIGLLNIAVSYGITKMKKWSLYLTILTSTLSLVFGCTIVTAMLYFFVLDIVDILILVGMSAYVILSATLLIYVLLKRENFS